MLPPSTTLASAPPQHLNAHDMLAHLFPAEMAGMTALVQRVASQETKVLLTGERGRARPG